MWGSPLRQGWRGEHRSSVTEGLLSLAREFEFHPRSPHQGLESKGGHDAVCIFGKSLWAATHQHKGWSRGRQGTWGRSPSALSPSWWEERRAPQAAGWGELDTDGLASHLARHLPLSPATTCLSLRQVSRLWASALPPLRGGGSTAPQSWKDSC